jgi:hypothetical protein
MHNVTQFAVAVVMNGHRCIQIQQVVTMCNQTVCAQTTFYRAQKTICEEIRKLADNFCRLWRNIMRVNSTIAMDRRWSEKRNANHCAVDSVDV